MATERGTLPKPDSLLVIGGSMLAGFVGQALGWYQAGRGAGWIASVLGAMVLLFVVQKLRASR